MLYYVLPCPLEEKERFWGARLSYLSFVSSFWAWKVLNTFRYSIIPWWMNKMWKAWQLENHIENNEPVKEGKRISKSNICWTYMHIYIWCMHICVCIYMYIYRERDRETVRENPQERIFFPWEEEAVWHFSFPN